MKNKLPEKLEVPCCIRKPLHGNIIIYLACARTWAGEKEYCYRRASNDEAYIRPMNKEELLNWVQNILPIWKAESKEALLN